MMVALIFTILTAVVLRFNLFSFSATGIVHIIAGTAVIAVPLIAILLVKNKKSITSVYKNMMSVKLKDKGILKTAKIAIILLTISVIIAVVSGYLIIANVIGSEAVIGLLYSVHYSCLGQVLLLLILHIVSIKLSRRKH